MPRQRLPPMPKLPAFALAELRPKRNMSAYLWLFFALFTIPLFVIHLPVVDLPFFWDEQGQFIPTALDLLRHGQWIAHSTLPNVHPPGVAAYLAGWFGLIGYSITVTRIAMLLVAGAGVFLTFVLAIELSRGVPGTPAFWPPLFLLLSPLFYMQAFLAQLDMPAMVGTLWVLLLALQRRWALAAAASVLLVLTKETGVVTPLVLFLLLLSERRWKQASYFAAPGVALAFWLIVLHHGTGYWLGNPGFAHYNVAYSLHPTRMLFTFVRRFYYLFIAEFRFLGTAAIVYAALKLGFFRSAAWRTTILVAAANILIVSVLGGAELERYLLPVLPLFYIAVAVALAQVRKPWMIAVTGLLAVGLVTSLFWNPPYPFPYENNWAMVDFVRLQESAADYVERNMVASRIATAWPYTASLRNPDFGLVTKGLKVVETGDFKASSIRSIPADQYDVLIVYTREWMPAHGAISYPIVRRFLHHFYEWQPAITEGECEALGLMPQMTWGLRGQQITIYVRRQSH